MRDRATEFLSRHERFQGFADVDELAVQMELLAEHGLDDLNERLLESPEEGFLDIVVEHNVGAILAGRAFRGLSYEPKGMLKPVDLVGTRGGYRYQLEVKRLAAPEIDRRQGKALKEVRRQLQSVILPVWLNLEVTKRFETRHAAPLVKSIRKAVKNGLDETHFFPSRENWVVSYQFTGSKTLRHAMVATVQDDEVRNVTGFAASRVAQKISKAYKKFSGSPPGTTINLVVLETDRTIHLSAVSDALYGTEYFFLGRGGDTIRQARHPDGCFSRDRGSRLHGVVVIRRTRQELFVPYEMILFPNPKILLPVLHETRDALKVDRVLGAEDFP